MRGGRSARNKTYHNASGFLSINQYGKPKPLAQAISQCFLKETRDNDLHVFHPDQLKDTMAVATIMPTAMPTAISVRE